MAEVTLYQFEISPFADKVRRVLNVKGVAYRTCDPGLSEIDQFKRKSPAGRLPVLDHKGVLIADSTDIAAFLEQTYPDPPLIPADPAQAGLVRILEDWADESLYWYELTMRLTWETNAPAVVGGMLAAAGVPGLMRGPAVAGVMKRYGAASRAQGVGAKPRAAVLRDLERLADSAEGFLGGEDFLVGGTLSLADIAVFCQLACIASTVEGGPLLAARPALAAWMGRVDAATAQRA